MLSGDQSVPLGPFEAKGNVLDFGWFWVLLNQLQELIDNIPIDSPIVGGVVEGCGFRGRAIGLPLEEVEGSEVFVEGFGDVVSQHFKDYELEGTFLMGVVEHKLEGVVQHLLIHQLHNKQHFLVGSCRVHLGLWGLLKRRKWSCCHQLVGGDVVEGVQGVQAGVLHRLSVLNRPRCLFAACPLASDLFPPQLDFPLPPPHTVELLVIFAEIKAAVV